MELEIFNSIQYLIDFLQQIKLLLESFYFYLKFIFFLIQLLELTEFWMGQMALCIMDSQVLLVYQSFNPPIKEYTLYEKYVSIKEF